MYSSQEDLFADNCKSICLDKTEGTFGELEATDIPQQDSSFHHVFPNSNIFVNINISASNRDQIKCFSVQVGHNRFFKS